MLFVEASEENSKGTYRPLLEDWRSLRSWDSNCLGWKALCSIMEASGVDKLTLGGATDSRSNMSICIDTSIKCAMRRTRRAEKGVCTRRVRGLHCGRFIGVWAKTKHLFYPRSLRRFHISYFPISHSLFAHPYYSTNLRNPGMGNQRNEEKRNVKQVGEYPDGTLSFYWP